MLKASILPLFIFTGSVFAQSFDLQIMTATNDKLQKGLGFYRAALEYKIGGVFLDKHLPIIERRHFCEWNGAWGECGYVILSNAGTINEEELTAIADVLADPCRFLDGKNLNFSNLCSKGFYRAKAVRTRKNDAIKWLKLNTNNIVFEIKIS